MEGHHKTDLKKKKNLSGRAASIFGTVVNSAEYHVKMCVHMQFHGEDIINYCLLHL